MAPSFTGLHAVPPGLAHSAAELANHGPHFYSIAAMFRRLMLLVTSLLTLLFVGLWMDRSLWAVSMDGLERLARHCEREFDRLDIELYRAIRADMPPRSIPARIDRRRSSTLI